MDNHPHQTENQRNESVHIYSREELMKLSVISSEKQSNNSANKALIAMRKNNNNEVDKSSKSLIVIKTSDKKISFNLIEDERFFHSIKSSSKLNQLKEELNTIEKSQSFCEGKHLFKNNIDLNSLKIKPKSNMKRLIDEFHRMNTNNFQLTQKKDGNQLSYSRIKTFPLQKSQCPMLNNESERLSNDFLLLTKQQLIEKQHNLLKDNLFLELLNKTNTVNQSSSKNQLDNVILNKNIERANLPQNYTICELCDFLTPIVLMKTLEPCQHLFCKRCGKHYYEDQIELGEIEFKCPYYFCSSKISEEMLFELISKSHLDRLFRGRNSNTVLSKPTIQNTYNTTTCERFPKGQSTFFTTIKDYNKKHVIDISQNDNTYLLYHRFKENICNKCNLPSLFGKNYSNTLKCLNCFGRFCKYCLQVIDSLDHFNTRSDNCCKSYKKFFLEQSVKQTPKNHCLSFSEQLFFFLLSYVILLIAGIIFIKNISENVLCLKNKEAKPMNTHISLRSIQNFSFYSQTNKKSLTRFIRKEKYIIRLCRLLKRILCIMIIIIISLIYSIVFLMLLSFYPVMYCIIEFALSFLGYS